MSRDEHNVLNQAKSCMMTPEILDKPIFFRHLLNPSCHFMKYRLLTRYFRALTSNAQSQLGHGVSWSVKGGTNERARVVGGNKSGVALLLRVLNHSTS